ncbi:hypothetical protein RJ640_029192, partial [Escallonia rubra]
MATHQEDLDLLLSLQDRVLETPPASPSAHSPGYLSDDGSSRRTGPVDMSIFKNAVQDCLDYEPQTSKKYKKPNHSKTSNDAEVERFSGLRIRNQLLSPAELSNRFADIRFVRLPSIKNLLVGDTLSGCWATVGVLAEKGAPKTSSTGKPFCIWKIGCLDENTIAVFLFGNAYQMNLKEEVGTIFALFNCGVRKDNVGAGFSLSIYSAAQLLKMGTSVDYGVCKGKRKDGMACTLLINKRRGIYCKYHKLVRAQSHKAYSDSFNNNRLNLFYLRNLRTAFQDPLKSRGIYVVDPFVDRTNLTKSMQPKKVLSVEGLRRALSNADKVTTNVYSQGKRFLAEMTGKMAPKSTNEGSVMPKQRMNSSEKRSSLNVGLDLPAGRTTQQLNPKRVKIEQKQASGEKIKE